MKIFRKLAEDKKMAAFLVLMVVAGAGFLLAGRLMNEPEEYIREAFYPAHAPQEAESFVLESFLHEQAIEERLEEFFAMVAGAGRVRVMVSPLMGRETVFATDVNETRSYSMEQDSEGGSRETRHYQINEKIVIHGQGQGTAKPLVIREIEPRIEGVVIIAEGGDSPHVRDALTRAARAVLGLEAHMVQVLTMK